MKITSNLNASFHWKLWWFAYRGRFIGQKWSFTIGPLSVSYYGEF